MTQTSPRLLGIGVAVPPGSLDQRTAAAMAEVRCCTTERQRSWLQRIYRHSGVERRGSVLLDAGGLEAFYPPPGDAEESFQARGPTTAARLERYTQEAAPLATTACRAAFAERSIALDAITHVVTVSCTGLVSPGLDAELIQRLGLSADVGRVNLGFMGCHGALNGLRTAEALVRGRPDACVLMCCVELCSLHFQYGWDTQKVVANGLFADGAAAVIVGWGNEGDRDDAPTWRLIDTASRLTQGSADAMTWRVGDHGFEMTLSSKVPTLIRDSLRDWLVEWLAGHQLTLSDVVHWAVHPGGPDILRAAGQALALPEGAQRHAAAVLAEHGNMSSPTVLFVIQRIHKRSSAEPCVMLGFGPGLSLEAALLC